jgi:hypothetical protein
MRGSSLETHLFHRLTPTVMAVMPTAMNAKTNIALAVRMTSLRSIKGATRSDILTLRLRVW